MTHRTRADGQSLYEHALAAAMHDIVGAFRDSQDVESGRRAARDVTAWLAGMYGRDAVRDLAEVLASRLAQLPVEHTRQERTDHEERGQKDGDVGSAQR